MEAKPEVSAAEHDVVKKCLQAAAEGPYFPDWEFDTLLGAARDEIRILSSGWSADRTDKHSVQLAACVLANLVGYPHGHERELVEEVGLSRDEIGLLAKKLNALL